MFRQQKAQLSRHVHIVAGARYFTGCTGAKAPLTSSVSRLLLPYKTSTSVPLSPDLSLFLAPVDWSFSTRDLHRKSSLQGQPSRLEKVGEDLGHG